MLLQKVESLASDSLVIHPCEFYKENESRDITRSMGFLSRVRARNQAPKKSVESFKVTIRLPSSTELPRLQGAAVQ